MLLSIHNVKSIRTVIRQFETKEGKKRYCREIEIKTEKGIDLISLYSNKKEGLKVQ